jgi:hypothetical protein
MSVQFPAIPAPNPSDLNSIAQSVMALKQAVEILTGATDKAAVTKANFTDQAYGINSYIQTQNATIASVSQIANNAAGSVASLTTTVSNQGAALSTVQARYSVTVDVNHRITGFSLLADGSGASTFDINADSFNVYASGQVNAAPMFSVNNVNGVTQVSIDGNRLPDLGILNRSIGNNAVSYSAASTGGAATTSGVARITVRAGSRVMIHAYYSGNDTGAGPPHSFFLRLYTSQNSAAYVQDAHPIKIPFTFDGGVFNYFPTTYVVVGTYAAGTLDVYCNTDNASFIGFCTIYVQELDK